jgi:hypothetical protein
MWRQRCLRTPSALLRQVESALLFYNERNKCWETTFDIGATAGEQRHMSQLVAAHALSDCDTVAQCFGVQKHTIIKVLKQWRIKGGAPFSPEIYQKMLIKLKIWDPKYINFLLFRGLRPPPFEISGSATVKSGVELNKSGVIGGHGWHYRGSGSFHDCPLWRRTLSDNKLNVLASSLYFVYSCTEAAVPLLVYFGDTKS